MVLVQTRGTWHGTSTLIQARGRVSVLAGLSFKCALKFFITLVDGMAPMKYTARNTTVSKC